MKVEHVKRFALGFVIPVIVLFLWFVTTEFGSVPSTILPGLPKVGQAFLEMVQSGQLGTDLSISLMRVVKGFLLSARIGVTLGSLMGMFEMVRMLCLPIMTVIRQIPMIAWIPLLFCGQELVRRQR